MKFDLIIFVNAKELKGSSAAEIHRLPLIESLVKYLREKGKILVVTHYVSLLADLWRYPVRIFKHILRPAERRISDNFFIYTPLVFFNLVIGRRIVFVKNFTKVQIKRQLQRVFNRNGFSQNVPKVVWLSHPYHIDYIDIVRTEKVIVYDCLEEFSLIGRSERDMRIVDVEKNLAEQVNIILAAGYSHTERLKKVNSQTYNFPQGVDCAKFALQPNFCNFFADDIKKIPTPRIGFCGCLKDYDNFELLEKIVSLQSEWSFVFVGGVAANISSRFNKLKSLSNVYFLGWREPKLLPYYLREFDVGIIISKVNELTNTFSPYKLYEYIGAGIPVVSTPIREVLQYEDIVEIADEPEQFVVAIARCLKQDRSEAERRRLFVLKKNSWDSRAKFALNLFHRELQKSCIK